MSERSRAIAGAAVVGALMSAAAAARAQGVDDIVGVSIACSNDRVFTWFRDGHVTIGNSGNLDAHQPHLPAHRYTLPPGKTTDQIVGMGISRQDHVYTWYRSGSVSIGTSSDLDARDPIVRVYALPPGKTTADIVGIDIACSTDRVYTWYDDGTVSIGTSTDLDRYQGPVLYTPAAGKTAADVVEIGIAGTRDQVYAWYDDRDASAGTSTDLDNFRPRFRYAVVTPPCDVFADPPQRQGPEPGFVLGIASRGPSCEESASITVQLVHERRLWFDRVLKEVSGGGTNFDLPVRLECTGREGRRLYLKVKGDGREKESARASIQFCF